MKYFKHELLSRDNDKIFELIEAHGMQGYGIWWAIVEELYKAEDNGFRIDATETWFKRLSKALALTDWRTLIRTLDTMAEHGLIDSQLWAEHVIEAPGINERADEYMRQKQLATERKRQQRERDRLAREQVSRVTDAGQQESHASVTTNTDPDPYSDPKKEKENIPRPKKNAHPAALMEERFRSGGKSSLPWVIRSINAYQHEYAPEMLEATMEYLKTTPSYEKTPPTLASAKSWLGVCNHPGNPDYATRMERAYIVWESAQKIKQRQQPTQDETEKREILAHLYRNYGGLPA